MSGSLKDGIYLLSAFSLKINVNLIMFSTKLLVTYKRLHRKSKMDLKF